MGSVGRVINHARKKTLKLSIIHGSVKKAKEALIKAHTLLKNISQYAEQLSQLEIWRHILSAAMRSRLQSNFPTTPTAKRIGIFLRALQ